MMSHIISLQFKEIIPTQADWDEFMAGLELDLASVEAQSLSRNLYYWLYNRYLGVATAYYTEDEFLSELGIAVQQYFAEALKKLEITREIYKLTAEDYEILAESLTNFSNSPNKKSGDPWALLDYASQQTRGRQKAGRLLAYLNALRMIPDAQINYIISKFDYLWLDLMVVSDDEFLYARSKKNV